jgi:hypothetical protein
MGLHNADALACGSRSIHHDGPKSVTHSQIRGTHKATIPGVNNAAVLMKLLKSLKKL